MPRQSVPSPRRLLSDWQVGRHTTIPRGPRDQSPCQAGYSRTARVFITQVKNGCNSSYRCFLPELFVSAISRLQWTMGNWNDRKQSRGWWEAAVCVNIQNKEVWAALNLGPAGLKEKRDDGRGSMRTDHAGSGRSLDLSLRALIMLVCANQEESSRAAFF